MKVIVLNGSPHKNGNVAAMAEAFVRGLRQSGHEVTVFDTAFMKIGGCLACEYCHTKGEGKCVQRDEMDKIYPVLAEAEMIVLVSPIYYQSFSAQLQAAVNRIYALDKPAKLKKAAMILSSGSDGQYDGAKFEYKGSFLDYLKLEDMGVYTDHGKEQKTPEKLEKIYQWGLSIK